MNRPKQTIDESLDKIKFMMNYDSNKTRLEQLQEQIPYNTSFLGTDTPAAAAPDAATPAPATPNETWASYGEINRAARVIGRASRLWSGLQGKVFGQGVNKQDAQKYALSMLKDDEKSIMGDKATLPTFHQVAQNVRQNLTQVPQQAQSVGYKPVTGTEDDPYRYGTSGEGIKTVQGLLGLVQDGKFGPKTQAKLQPLGLQTFTDQDIPAIQSKMGNQSDKFTSPPTAQTTQLRPKVGTNPKVPLTQKPGGSLIKPKLA